MKKSVKTTMLGVTLLEIMLVLAIAGVLIAMSIQYYQKASANQKITSGLSAVSGIAAAVESYRMAGTGSLDQITSITILSTYFPGGIPPVSPWTNGDITVVGASTGIVTISMPITSNACATFQAAVVKQGGFTSATTCPATLLVITMGNS